MLMNLLWYVLHKAGLIGGVDYINFLVEFHADCCMRRLPKGTYTIGQCAKKGWYKKCWEVDFMKFSFATQIYLLSVFLLTVSRFYIGAHYGTILYNNPSVDRRNYHDFVYIIINLHRLFYQKLQTS